MKGKLMNDIKETWFKWDYVCTNCDSHVEMTIKSIGLPHSEVCPKCHFALSLMSVADATIPSIPAQPKENKMDTLLTLREQVIQEMELKYGNDITELKNQLSTVTIKYDNLVSELHIYNNQRFLVDNIISSRFEDSDDQDTLKEIAQALGISITKEITWSATVTIQGTAEVDITDEYDLESRVYDELVGELYNYDFSIDDVEER
jgi:hypothetical protein